ncbi:PapB/FocB family fimbrial expression transcriptional regulator [Yersinia enterocolitica]|uniref:PapB/FocB family fimbrial expression transcriptional regulator n=1 Tax=Yersinia enterocolitica TaxID=630 RepID=UPI00398C9A26
MDFLNKDNYLFGEKPGYLVKGRVHSRHFKLLIEVSHIRSTKIIRALEGYLVQDKEAKDVCDQYGITNSYFLITLRRLQEISYCISCMIPYYSEAPPKDTCL